MQPVRLPFGALPPPRRAPITAAQHVSFNRNLEWHRLGAPYDLWLFDDLAESAELDRYKVVVLPAQLALTVDQRLAVREKLERNGRTLVWMYAPGVFRAEGSHLDLADGNRANQKPRAVKRGVFDLFDGNRRVYNQQVTAPGIRPQARPLRA